MQSKKVENLDFGEQKMSRTMKEIVMMLELSAENDWIDAFYLPFELNPGFKVRRFIFKLFSKIFPRFFLVTTKSGKSLGG